MSWHAGQETGRPEEKVRAHRRVSNQKVSKRRGTRVGAGGAAGVQ